MYAKTLTHFQPKIIAIIGATCSGKSALALKIAPFFNAYIFSIDSLSIYQEIDIASAKPSLDELSTIKHFAINVLKPSEYVNAGIFLDLLHETLDICSKDSKNLIIVGGSSFYLKSIIHGLSPKPKGNLAINATFQNLIALPLPKQYEFLSHLDKIYCDKIKPTDSYRIQKGIEIFSLTGLSPSNFFMQNPAIPFHLPITIYNIKVPKEILHTNIYKRTTQMLQHGIIDETEAILQKYGSAIQPFKSIGLKECLMYLQHNLAYSDLHPLISTHTKQLAKRQTTFNRTQFSNSIELDILSNFNDILTMLQKGFE